MFHTAVCVCTYRNPAGLQALLEGLDRQELLTISVAEVCVVVVDNDDKKTAGTVLDRYAVDGRFLLARVNQPVRGLSTARNSALDAPEVRSSKFFAFLDDDEVPGDQWLQSFASAMQDSAYPILVGPVEPRFVVTPPAWITSGCFFHKPCLPEGELHQGYTSNVMLRTSLIRDAGVRFDESLNQIGGEDVVFFRELRIRNLGVRCVPSAVVFETIPPERATLSWMLRRWVRTGATSALLDNVWPLTLETRLKIALRGVARIFAGLSRTLMLALIRGRGGFHDVARSLSTACRGAGMFMAAFGHSYKEYGSSYRREHS